MQTKRPIVQFFVEHFPEFGFAGEHRPNLLFRAERANGLHWAIAIQRDGPSCGLAAQMAATYLPRWKGGPASPWGWDTGLENLRLGSRAVEAMEAWFIYDATPEGLRKALREIRRQMALYGLPFLADAEIQLGANVLLQAALAAGRSMPVESRAGLEEAAARVGYRLDALEHPAYDRMREYLEGLITPRTPENERMWTRRLAYECFFLREWLAKRPQASG